MFNNIQVTNDRTMQAILTEAQKEAKLSQKLAMQSYLLAQRMREDGIAMKTVRDARITAAQLQKS